MSPEVAGRLEARSVRGRFLRRARRARRPPRCAGAWRPPPRPRRPRRAPRPARRVRGRAGAAPRARARRWPRAGSARCGRAARPATSSSSSWSASCQSVSWKRTSSSPTVFVEPRSAAGGHPAREPAELGLGGGRPALEHAPADELLEHDAHARDLLEQPRRELGDARAAPRQAHDEAFLGEPRERLAHGDVARPELAGDGALDEPRARGIRAVANQIAQLIGDAAGDADRELLGGGSHSAGVNAIAGYRVKRQ